MENLPLHVGIIMDGNGRWAKKRIQPRAFGHKAGMNRLISLAEHAQKTGIKYLTLYVLSTENLSRPQDELDGLFGLFRKYFTSNVKKLYESNARIRIIGDKSALPEDIQKLLTDSELNSPKNASFTLVFAINYGSRTELPSQFAVCVLAMGAVFGPSVVLEDASHLVEQTVDRQDSRRQRGTVLPL